MSLTRVTEGSKDEFIGHLELVRTARLEAVSTAPRQRDKHYLRGQAEGLTLAIRAVRDWDRVAELEKALRKVWDLAQHAPVNRPAESVLGAIQREVSAHVGPHSEPAVPVLGEG